MEIIKYKTPTGFRYKFVALSGYTIKVPNVFNRYSKVDYDVSSLQFRCAYRKTIDKCMLIEYGSRVMVQYRQAIDDGTLDRAVVKKISDHAKKMYGEDYLSKSKEGIEYVEKKYRKFIEKKYQELLYG